MRNQYQINGTAVKVITMTGSTVVYEVNGQTHRVGRKWFNSNAKKND